MITHLLGFSVSIRCRWTVFDKRIHYGIPEILKELRYRSLISGSRTVRYSSSPWYYCIIHRRYSELTQMHATDATIQARIDMKLKLLLRSAASVLFHQRTFDRAFISTGKIRKNIATSPVACKRERERERERAGKNNLSILNIRLSITTMN